MKTNLRIFLILLTSVWIFSCNRVESFIYTDVTRINFTSDSLYFSFGTEPFSIIDTTLRIGVEIIGTPVISIANSGSESTLSGQLPKLEYTMSHPLSIRYCLPARRPCRFQFEYTVFILKTTKSIRFRYILENVQTSCPAYPNTQPSGFVLQIDSIVPTGGTNCRNGSGSMIYANIKNSLSCMADLFRTKISRRINIPFYESSRRSGNISAVIPNMT